VYYAGVYATDRRAGRALTPGRVGHEAGAGWATDTARCDVRAGLLDFRSEYPTGHELLTPIPVPAGGLAGPIQCVLQRIAR
jgi:hypothetical protein